jgi:hypothetical protein
MHLTYYNQDVYSETVSTAPPRERLARPTDIEVTLEMIEAGVDCFFDTPGSELLWSSPEDFRDVVRRCFLTMLRMRSEHPCEGQRRDFVNL